MTPPDKSQLTQFELYLMEKIDGLEETTSKIREEVAALKVKAGLWGGVSGALTAAAAYFGIGIGK
jgi:hypothetical protein